MSKVTEAAIVFLAFSASYALTDMTNKALWALGMGGKVIDAQEDRKEGREESAPRRPC